MGQVGLFERRNVVRPISIVKTISKLTNAFTMMKFLAMFCLFIALFNEMEANPIEAKPPSTLQVVSERVTFGAGWGVGGELEDYSDGCTNTSEGCHYDDDDREDEEDTGEDDNGNNSDEDDGGDEEDDKTADDEKEDIEEDGDEEEEEDGYEDDEEDNGDAERDGEEEEEEEEEEAAKDEEKQVEEEEQEGEDCSEADEILGN